MNVEEFKRSPQEEKVYVLIDSIPPRLDQEGVPSVLERRSALGAQLDRYPGGDAIWLSPQAVVLLGESEGDNARIIERYRRVWWIGGGVDGADAGCRRGWPCLPVMACVSTVPAHKRVQRWLSPYMLSFVISNTLSHLEMACGTVCNSVTIVVALSPCSCCVFAILCIR